MFCYDIFMDHSDNRNAQDSRDPDKGGLQAAFLRHRGKLHTLKVPTMVVLEEHRDNVRVRIIQKLREGGFSRQVLDSKLDAYFPTDMSPEERNEVLDALMRPELRSADKDMLMDRIAHMVALITIEGTVIGYAPHDEKTPEDSLIIRVEGKDGDPSVPATQYALPVRYFG
jgi:hypothetical protein